MTGFYPTSEAWAIEGGNISGVDAFRHPRTLWLRAPSSLTRLALGPRFVAGNAVGLGLGAESTEARSYRVPLQLLSSLTRGMLHCVPGRFRVSIRRAP